MHSINDDQQTISVTDYSPEDAPAIDANPSYTVTITPADASIASQFPTRLSTSSRVSYPTVIVGPTGMRTVRQTEVVMTVLLPIPVVDEGANP